MASKRKQIFVPNNPLAPRLCPELAAEIGLTESILLLQMEYWLTTSKAPKQEGIQWTYQSLSDIQETFKFWSKETIRRGLQRLEQAGLIKVGTFNRSDWDRTKWYTLDLDGIAQLKSIRLVDIEDNQQSELPISQSEKSISQSDHIDSNKMRNRTPQNETTIPEITTETTNTENTTDLSSLAESQEKIIKPIKTPQEKPAKKPGKTGMTKEQQDEYIIAFAEAAVYDPKDIFVQKWVYGQLADFVAAKYTVEDMRGCVAYMKATNGHWWATKPMTIADVKKAMPVYKSNGGKLPQRGQTNGRTAITGRDTRDDDAIREMQELAVKSRR